MAEGQSPFQKKLLSFVESVFGKPEAPPPPAKPQPGRTGALPRGAAPAAPSARRADSFVSGGSGPLSSRAAQTGQLGPQRGQTASLPASAPAAEAFAEDPAAASKRRMGLIMAYMKDAQGDPAFQDKTLMYRLLTEERSYQQEQIQQLKTEIGMLFDEEPDVKAELEERLKTAQNRQTQLFILLKRLTGIQGKTGGTGFLAQVEPTD